MVTGVQTCALPICLVLGETLQLMETPRMEPPALLRSNLGRAADVRQILENQGAAGIYRANQFLGEDVVAVFAETSLPTREAFKVPLGRLRAFRLQPTLELEGSIFDILPVLGAVKVAFAVRGRMDDSKVNANKFAIRCYLDNLGRHHDMKPPTILSISDEVGAGGLPGGVFGIVVGDLERQPNSSFQGKDRDFLSIKPDLIGPSIVADGAEIRLPHPNFLALFNKCFIGLQSLGRLHPGSTNQLGRKSSHSLMRVVGGLVEFHAVGDPVFPSEPGNFIERQGVRHHRLLKKSGGFGIRPEPNSYRSLNIHGSYIPKMS